LAALVAGPSAAQTRVLHVHSAILSEDRIVHISLPANYALAKQRYQVTYLLDGQVRQFFDLTVASSEYDIIGDSHDYATPPQIVVGVDQRDRATDLARNQELFTRFLVEELVPFVDHNYRTTGYRTLIGHSLGGRFALMTFCRAPAVFPAVIAISAAGGDSSSVDSVVNCLAASFASNHTTVRQLVLSAGEREPRVLAGVKRIADHLRANAPSNWRWTVIDGAGLGHTETPLATIPPGMRFVHDKTVWEMPAAIADSILAGQIDAERAIDSFYVALGVRVGSTVVPSLKWMLAAARIHVKRHDGTAEDAVRRLIAAYPEDLEGYGMLAELAIDRGDRDLARRTFTDARGMLDRLEMHDIYDRERKQRLLDDAIAALKR
jgi:enterochelin esterase-like enzyme